MYLRRGLETRVQAALASSPVVVLEGARGVGKTQLAEHLVGSGSLAAFRTLADETTLAAATDSPKAFISDLPFGTVVDEAQLVPEIQLAIKSLVDKDTSAGRFLLTGSSRLAQDSLGGSPPLAGRSVTLKLEPFTQSERGGTPLSVVSTLFDGDPQDLEFKAEHQSQIIDRTVQGGFLTLRSDDQRLSFLDDLLPSAEVGRRDRTTLTSVGRHLASDTARMYAAKTFADNLGLDTRTVNGHLELWERLMIARRLPNWRPTHGASERAQRKVLLADTGLARTWGELDIATGRGQLIETFVANELIAQGWAIPDVRFLHYRESDRYEVDLILSRTKGRQELIGVEMKAAAEVRAGDFKQLREFRTRSKGKMTRGFVFYTGDTIQSFSDDMWALPIPVLWGVPDRTVSPLARSVQGLAAALTEGGSLSALASRLPSLEARLARGTVAVHGALDLELDSIEQLVVATGAPLSELARYDMSSQLIPETQELIPELTGTSTPGPHNVRLLSIAGSGRAVVAQATVFAMQNDRVAFSVAAGITDLDPSTGFGNVTDVEIVEIESSDAEFTSDSVESAFAQLMPHIADLLARL